MLLFSLFLPFVLGGDKNGGVTCAACGIITSWVDQYSSFHGKTAEEGIRDICRLGWPRYFLSGIFYNYFI